MLTSSLSHWSKSPARQISINSDVWCSKLYWDFCKWENKTKNLYLTLPSVVFEIHLVNTEVHKNPHYLKTPFPFYFPYFPFCLWCVLSTRIVPNHPRVKERFIIDRFSLLAWPYASGGGGAQRRERLLLLVGFASASWTVNVKLISTDLFPNRRKKTLCS